MIEEKIEIKWNPFQQDDKLPLSDGIKKLYELYELMQKSGFTKVEALTLLSAMMAGVMK